MKAYTLTFPKWAYWLTFFGLASSIVVMVAYLVNSTSYLQNELMTFAVTADLALTVPLIYYFLVVRTQKISWFSTLVVYLVMVTLATFILPNESQTYLYWFEMSLILTEGFLVTVLIINIRKIIKQYRIEKERTGDFIVNLDNTLTTVLKKSLPPVVSEIAMLRYAFLFWKIPVEALPHQKAFSVHKKSGTVAMYIAFMFAIVAEATAVHFLLVGWNETVAIILLILSIYSLFFVIGLVSSITKRPILVDGDAIIIRIGLMWKVEIQRNDIEYLELVKRVDEKDKSIENLAAILLTSPNMILHLKSPVIVHGIYGIKKTTSKLAIFVDDKEGFQKAVSI
jgi:hypothetical protein